MLHFVLWVGLAVGFPGSVDIDSPWRGSYKTRPKAQGIAVLELWGHPERSSGYPHAAVFSKDGKRALHAHAVNVDPENFRGDSVLTLWDVDKAQVLKEIQVPKCFVAALDLSADAKLAVASLEHVDEKGQRLSKIALWDLDAGKEIKSRSLEEPVFALAFAPDGKRVLAAAGARLVWPFEEKKIKAVEKAPDYATALAIHPDGSKALVGFSNELKLWDLRGGKVLHSLKGHQGHVFSLTCSPDGKRAVSAGGDNSIRLWDLASGKELAVLQKPAVNSLLIEVAFADEGRKVLAVWTSLDAATGTQEQCEVGLWDGEAKKELWSVRAQFKGRVPIAMTADGKQALLGGGANPFCLFDLADGREKRIWGSHTSAVNAVLAGHKGHILSAGQDGTLKVWENAAPKQTWRGHADAINALAITADQQLVATASADKTIKIWDLRRATKTLAGHTGNVTGVAFSPDGKWLVSGSNDRTLKIWDVATAKESATLTGHSEGINSVAVAPDGTWIASAGDDNTVRLWPVKNGKPDADRDPVVLEDHKRQVTSVVFSPDGKQLLSGSQDTTIKVWDVAKRKVTRTLTGHKNWITSLGYLKENVAYSCSDDLTVRVWDVAQGKEIGQVDLGSNSDCPRCLAVLSGKEEAFVIGTSGWVLLKCRLEKK